MPIKKIKLPKPIYYFLVLAVILNVLRIFLFNTTSFLYMFWNIFLAFIPFFISSILLIYTKKENILRPFFIIGFILWFLFLPNAPYVITDFIHLGRIRAVPAMYDIFVLLSSSITALLFGLYSLSHMEKMLLLKFKRKVVSIFIIFIILFASFGIYLGRFLRFNSWDFFTSHVSLFSSIWDIFTKSNNYINVYSYTLLFFSFIYISYLAFKSANLRE